MIETYYLETHDGLFFAVKGLEHPPDRTIAVLRYVPDPEGGTRKKGDKAYRRLYHFNEQEQLIRTAYPQYLAYDPVFQTTLQSVPWSTVRRIYDPRERIQEWAQNAARSAVEEDAYAFACLLQEKAQVPFSALGIAGSLLIGLHTEHSDLDAVAFGSENCKKVYQTLRRLLDDESRDGLSRLDRKGLEELYAERVKDTQMDFRKFVDLEKQKVNQGSFRNRPYFIRFIKEPRETGLIYGQQRYVPLGRVCITASIADDSESIFTPCRYALADVRILEGPQQNSPGEIVSFRGRFCEQARVGDSIAAAGTLERIEKNTGEVSHRLLLGNAVEDTMVPA
jgi:uncharacterized protein